MRLIIDTARLVSKLGAGLAAGIMALVVCHIMLEIALRSLFSTSTFVLDELVGYAVAAMTFLALGYALDQKALIRVNVFLSRIGTGVARRFVELFCVTSTFALVALVAWHFWRNISRNYSRGSVSETVAEIPLWIPESFVLIGLLIFMLQLFALFLAAAAGENTVDDPVADEPLQTGSSDAPGLAEAAPGRDALPAPAGAGKAATLAARRVPEAG